MIHSRDCSVQEVYATIPVSQVRSLLRPPTVTTPQCCQSFWPEQAAPNQGISLHLADETL